MNLSEALRAYLENTTEKAARLRVSRKTLYNWRNNPDSANLRIIAFDLAEQLSAINGRIVRMEEETTAHGRIMDERQSDK